MYTIYIVTERAIPGYKINFATILHSRAIVSTIAWLSPTGDRWQSQLNARD